LKSSFKTDLEKEQKLSVLLDTYYSKHLEFYNFERITDKIHQFEGVDLVFTHSKTKKLFLVDEKAQLDYINETLPTFAFELSYQKKGIEKKGWLYDQKKKTDFYALVTSIYSDLPYTFTSCKITFVNRVKLIFFLKTRGYTEQLFSDIQEMHRKTNGVVVLEKLDSKNEGYLYFSTRNKAEKPVNLILKLDFLIKIGVAKRLI